jgi:hypothetical protein
MKLVSYSEINTNIGDLLQTISLKNYIESKYPSICIDGYCDRRNLENNMIINGWHRNTCEPLPHSAMYIGIHTDYKMIWNLRISTIIGCRDVFTMKEVSKYIDKYKVIFSGCSTITIPEFKGDRIGAKEYLHSNNDENLNFAEQIKKIDELIDDLKTKELVITDRLHIAIPCIALGTPVILNPRKFQKERYTIFDFFPEFPGFGKVITKECGLRENMLKTFENAFEKIYKNYINIKKK